MSGTNLQSWKDIVNISVLNVLENDDQFDEFQIEVEKLFGDNIDLICFEGKNTTENPYKGITHGECGKYLGHIDILNAAIQNKYSHVLICEDKIQFLNIKVLKKAITHTLTNATVKDWNVLMLAGVHFGSVTKQVSERCIKVFDCECSGCYLVQSGYFQKLRDHYVEGLRLLVESADEPDDNPHPEYGINMDDFALDKYWKRLQKRDNWYLLTPLSVVKAPGYSDIWMKEMDRTKEMLQLNNERKSVPLTVNEQKYMSDDDPPIAKKPVQKKAKYVKAPLHSAMTTNNRKPTEGAVRVREEPVQGKVKRPPTSSPTGVMVSSVAVVSVSKNKKPPRAKKVLPTPIEKLLEDLAALPRVSDGEYAFDVGSDAISDGTDDEDEDIIKVDIEEANIKVDVDNSGQRQSSVGDENEELIDPLNEAIPSILDENYSTLLTAGPDVHSLDAPHVGRKKRVVTEAQGVVSKKVCFSISNIFLVVL
jgi:hypothetical protein